MAEIGPEHPLTYREEITRPLFTQLSSATSLAVVGSSSMGKSRLLQFLRRGDVLAHYLGEKANHLVLVWVDQHRLAALSEWAFYELLLTALIEEVVIEPSLPASLHDRLETLRDKVIESRNGLLARRHVELAVKYLCVTHGLTLYFLFDEFDHIYQALPASALNNLRALRDRHKYQVSYILLLRDKPERLRDPRDHEGFYELFSRSQLGLQPYGGEDANRIIEQLKARKSFHLHELLQEQILALSGGHPGLIVTLFGLAQRYPEANWNEWEHWLANSENVVEECQKIWLGLAEDERLVLKEIVHQAQIPIDGAVEVLRLKGLIKTKGKEHEIFSPLLAQFIREQNVAIGSGGLEVDEAYGVVRIGRVEIDSLTPLEFRLLAYLAQRKGEVCKRGDVLGHLYPDEEHNPFVNDNRIDSLVRHVRKKIEQGSKPRYLLTVRGVGYRLIANPDGEAAKN